MKTLHDGTQVADDAICGSNAGKYPRLDKDGNRLDGHGLYLLQGDELDTYTSERDLYKSQAPKRAQQVIKNEIKGLEKQITSRRLRDAILGKDGGWLAKQDMRIEAERAKLNGS